MIKIQFLTMPGCHSCETVKQVLNEVMVDFKDKAEITEMDMTTPDGQELVQKYGIMASPGVIINDELFSTGGIDREKLVEKLKSL